MPSPDELPPPATPSDDIRRAADEILSRPEFTPPPKSLYDRIVDALQEALSDVLSAFFSGGRSAIVAWIALLVVGAVVAFLLFRVVRSVRGSGTAAPPVSVTSETRRPATEWEREAEEHAAAGRWRDAVRCRYRALVATLAARGAVDEVPGRTAGEYRLEVLRTRPDAAVPFADATDVFERAWYGAAPTEESDDRRFRQLASDALDASAR